MRIGIDARMYGKGFGLARYIEQLILHLEKIDTSNEYIIFLKKDNYHEFEPTCNNFTKVLADIPWYSVAEQCIFPRLIKKQNIDLMHFPHFNVPIFYKKPYIVTIHDLIMFHYPRQEASTHGPFVYKIKDILHRVVLSRALKGAKHVLVTSEFTKQDIHETLGTPLAKMTVTYQAPFEGAKNIQQDAQSLLKKYGITSPYIMYVGAAYPHKNLEGLLSGWEIFQKKYGQEYQLVLVGKENFFYTKLKETVLPHSKNVIYTGFVRDDELSCLYKNALLYVFPSLYEGFGLPPLEAMVHGVPVVSSNRSCLPEVLGDAALYFDPEKREELAECLSKGIKDENVRFCLMQKASQVLSEYSWDILAEQTLHIYQKQMGD